MRAKFVSILLGFILLLSTFPAALEISGRGSDAVHVAPSNVSSLSVLHVDGWECTFNISYSYGAGTVYVPLFQEVDLPSPLATNSTGYFQRVYSQNWPSNYSDVYGNSFTQFSSSSPGSLEIDAKVIILGSIVFFNSDDVGTLEEIPSTLNRTLYTQPEPLIESNDTGIQSKAQEVKAGVDDIYLIVQRVLNFTHNHIKYTSMQEPKGALYALKSREGDCTEYSCLMTALLRALNIPTRINAGYAWDPEANKFILHAWVEVFMPRLGWIPFDPAWNLFGCWRHVALFRHCNEKQGPTIPQGYELGPVWISHLSFSDQIYLETDASTTLNRTFLTTSTLNPSAIVRLAPNQFLNCNLVYSTVQLKTRQEFLGLLTSIRYVAWNYYPPKEGYTIVVNGPSLSFVGYQLFQPSSSISYEVSFAGSDNRPVLNLSIRREREESGYFAASIYYLSTVHLAFYSVLTVAMIVVIWYIWRKRIEKRRLTEAVGAEKV